MVHPPGGSLGAGREAGGPRPRLSQGRPRHAEAAEGGASGVGERVTMERIGIERREMMDQTTPQAERHRIDLSPYPLVALVLQGGGALGAYQAGAYEALAEENIHPNWIAGISIGAINAAIIAGNAPKTRVEKLGEFWKRITTPIDLPEGPAAGVLHPLFNMTSALSTVMLGQPGFFTPWLLSPWIQQAGAPGAISYYNTTALRATLEE